MDQAAQQVQEPQVPQEEIEVAEEEGSYLLADLVVEALVEEDSEAALEQAGGVAIRALPALRPLP